jgi:hypothetical protein
VRRSNWAFHVPIGLWAGVRQSKAKPQLPSIPWLFGHGQHLAAVPVRSQRVRCWAGQAPGHARRRIMQVDSSVQAALRHLVRDNSSKSASLWRRYEPPIAFNQLIAKVAPSVPSGYRRDPYPSRAPHTSQRWWQARVRDRPGGRTAGSGPGSRTARTAVPSPTGWSDAATSLSAPQQEGQPLDRQREPPRPCGTLNRRTVGGGGVVAGAASRVTTGSCGIASGGWGRQWRPDRHDTRSSRRNNAPAADQIRTDHRGGTTGVRRTKSMRNLPKPGCRNVPMRNPHMGALSISSLRFAGRTADGRSFDTAINHV